MGDKRVGDKTPDCETEIGIRVGLRERILPNYRSLIYVLSLLLGPTGFICPISNVGIYTTSSGVSSPWGVNLFHRNTILFSEKSRLHVHRIVLRAPEQGKKLFKIRISL